MNNLLHIVITFSFFLNFAQENPCELGDAIIKNHGIVNFNGISVCNEEMIQLMGDISGVYHEDLQLDYKWNIGDGRVLSGKYIEFNYNSPGAYNIGLEIIELNTSNNSESCIARTVNDFIVKVSGSPEIIIQTINDNGVFCANENVAFSAEINPFKYEFDCSIPVSDSQFLPDGNGESYKSCITVECFDDSKILESVSDINKICVEIEHSYLGDLEIGLLSPSGDRIVLKAYAPFGGGGGFYLGGPKDYGVSPGEGAVYCFTLDANELLINGDLTLAGDPKSNSIISGDYLPVDSFNSLIGSSLNGEWCLEITDNLLFDNGYIFGWTIEFNNDIEQNEIEFETEIAYYNWKYKNEIVAGNVSDFEINNLAEGEHCFELELIDDIGCYYTEELCVVVEESVQLNNSNWDLFNCSASNGHGQFNFESIISDIINQNLNKNIKIKFYETYQNSVNNHHSIASISDFQGFHDQVIYVRVDNLNSKCYDIADFKLLLDVLPPEVPIINDVSVECFYAIEVPIAKDNCSGDIPGILVSNTDLNAFGAYDLKWEFKDDAGNLSYAIQYITIIDNYVDVFLDDLKGCEIFNGSGFDFDLSTNRNLILEYQQKPNNYEISFYDSLENAESQCNSLNDNYHLSEDNFVEIFVRINDVTRNDLCSVRYSMFTLKLQPYMALDFDVKIESKLKGALSNLKVSIFDSNEYEFRLDDGVWRRFGEFEDVLAGEHIIQVKSIDGCNLTSERVVVFGLPVYFTPNNDGYNDVWSIKKLPEYLDVSIDIFDRFGRVLTQLNKLNTCWNGTVKGELLPEDDYWYKIVFKDPNTSTYNSKVSHFTLKR